ncbi:MAG: hypothetical protein NT015_11435 [Alphaproteobacteria bacterium]|nr:hypothetical protein [Alphaproteobacteria bacterium]
MRVWVFVFMSALLAAQAAPARADWPWHYGAVVCAGDAALVRFTRAYNEEEPEFAGPPEPFARTFARARLNDPSQCRLRDGRLVTPRHANDRDGRPYGMNGGVDTEWFTLTIGDRVIYPHEVFLSRTADRIDLAIVYARGRLSECRTREGEFLNERDIPVQCVDASARLPGAIVTAAPDPRPHMRLVRAVTTYRAICESFIQSRVVTFQPPNGWPAFLSTEPRDRIEISGVPIEEPTFDLDNDGRSETPIRITGESGYFDGQFWMLPPNGAAPTQQQINEAEGLVIDGRASEARAAGWRIYSGDQTALTEPRYTWLQPISFDGETLLTAEWASQAIVSRSLVLRPTPNGALEEVCAYELDR